MFKCLNIIISKPLVFVYCQGSTYGISKFGLGDKTRKSTFTESTYITRF